MSTLFLPSNPAHTFFIKGPRADWEEWKGKIAEKKTKTSTTNIDGAKHQLPRDIQWHFIGHLQSNKCKTVAGKVDILLDLYSLF
jgi:uncharacterized pyridoxal phosphate-containing UPF0001 family protein